MKKITKILSLGLLLLSGVGFVVAGNSKEAKVEEASAYTSPSTYYSTVSGTGSSLLSSINTKINQNLTRISYDNLKTNAYPYTDVRSDGYIYDIYSDNTQYEPGSAFAGSYKNVGDGYNREHTIPQSWWGGGTTLQGCDLYIVLPSDAKANGMRSNYPYGETTSGTPYKLDGDPSGNRLGTSTSTQYVTGTVFEPFDSRKGDLARIYFYAVAMYLNDGCKNGKVTKWTDGEGTSVFSASGNNGFVQEYLNMLLKWHKDDPVSQWEIDRNNNGENRQGNRNPFVDHPSWVDLIWGGTYPSSGTNYENTNGGTASVVNGVISGGSSTPTVNSVTVSPSSLSLNLTNTTTGILTATVNVSNGAAQTVTWTSNNTGVATVNSSGVVTAVAAGNATITATSTVDSTKKGTCTVTVSSGSSGGGNSIAIIPTDLASGTYPTTATSYTCNSGLSIAAYNCANFSSKIQFKKSGGYLYSNSSLNLNTLTISGLSGTLTVYAGSSKNPSSTTITGTNGVYNLSGNTFFKIINNSSSVATCSEITIATQSASSKTLSSISISGYTTSFTEGDTFSFGGTVTANYSDSTSTNVTASATFTGYDMTSVSNQTVTVSYTESGTTKTQTYNISVSAGTLSSISVSGQTTTYVKNASFSFDGTCTATFANGYEKEVSPTSVSSPDMSTTGSKTITVSYTYNGKTKSTTYTITVNSYRTVMEDAYSVIGTIVYTTGSEVISNASLSTSKSGYTTIENAPDAENKAIRLGSGSNTGTLTISSTTSNIRKIIVNACSYSSDTSVSITIGGTSNTLTSSYADYSKEYTTATNSVAISTTTNKKRAWIASVTVYSKASTDIGTTSDCVGLETFIENNMHMDYTSNLGYCKDNTHHYYSTAKSAFNGLNTHQRALFVGNSAYSSEWARLSAWASINGDSLNASNILESNGKTQTSIINNQDSTSVIIMIISLLSITALGGFLFIKHKKEER